MTSEFDYYQIQDDGGRHIEFRKMAINRERLNRFAPNLIRRWETATYNSWTCQKNVILQNPRWGTAAILKSQNMV